MVEKAAIGRRRFRRLEGANFRQVCIHPEVGFHISRDAWLPYLIGVLAQGVSPVPVQGNQLVGERLYEFSKGVLILTNGWILV